MLKFKGKPSSIIAYIKGLKYFYGEKTTLKEVIKILGELNNVSM